MLLPVVQFQWVSILTLYFAYGGFIIFLYGFFPIKYHGGAQATWDDLPTNIGGVEVDPSKVYALKEIRVVLMVVDALRYDFVSEKYMPYTADLIKKKQACLYRATAEPPTVTMPRLKAMTTGSISNFIDVALNFGSSAVTEDSFINQAKINKLSTIFYGDDTWLRLFPDAFMRSEGTTSFFVTDYTEVDLNVTRHLPRELGMLRPDWDVMILHYLGLDHIGHLEGPSSPKILPKMLEMDNVVQMIMNASTKWRESTAIFICGDHGMKDSGGHGGASYSEVTVPLVFIHNNTCSDTHSMDVDQIDLAVTISYILGIPFPGSNIGQILPQIISDSDGDLSSKEALYALHYNAKLNMEALSKILGMNELQEKECYKQYLSAVKQHSGWLDPKGTGSAKIAASLYKSSLDNMSHYLTKSVVEFDTFAIIVGIFVVLMTLISEIFITIVTYRTDSDTKYHKMFGFNKNNLQKRLIIMTLAILISSATFVLVCGISQTGSSLCKPNIISFSSVAVIITIISTNTAIIRNIINNMSRMDDIWSLNAIEAFLIIGTAVQPITYGGTSFIEEEHQTWYFFWTTITFLTFAYTAKILLDYYRKKSENATEIQDKESLSVKMEKTAKTLLPQWLILMVIHRFLRTLNQTGDKWAFLPDVGDWLYKDENYEILSILALAALLSTVAICQTNLQHTLLPYKTSCLLCFAAALCIFLYRVAIKSVQIPFFGHLELNELYTVRVFWFIIFATIVLEWWYSKRHAHEETKNILRNKSRMSSNGVGENQLFLQTNVHNDNAFQLSVIQTAISLRMKMLASKISVFTNIMLLICSLYLRPHNLILVPSICVTSRIINKVLDYKVMSSPMGRENDLEGKNAFSKTLFHIWIGSLFYFYQGNSNSLASVDLGSGYIGLESYIPPIVALQMGIHTFVGPLLSILLLFLNLVQENQQWDKFMQRIRESLSTIATHRTFVLLVYTVICTILRYHLFVWTVFSPKLLYEFMTTFFIMMSMFIILIMCTLVVWQERWAFFRNSKIVRSNNKSRNVEE